ncbi:MAG: HAD family hydrolase [Gammaproteobacteria bacterium]|nr:HAD family hydrolase [Gammaproteobacteria bacterium]MCP5443089.1 HAD family hydrolase [Chromatiaceae bacterium]
MALAIFDLDNTLLAGDSDYLWGKFLAGTGAVDGERYERENLRFYRQYQAGDLDIHEFLRFSLRPLREHSVEQLHRWRNEFLTREIDPIITLASRELIDRHRRAGDTLMIITATNSFVTAPIAERLGIDHLIATIPEIKHGRYTGEVEGIPSFREGKVKRLQIWLDEHAQDLGESSFYSDSHNDIPLLELVDNPVAVDPDEELAAQAVARNWPVISLRSPLAHGMAPA